MLLHEDVTYIDITFYKLQETSFDVTEYSVYAHYTPLWNYVCSNSS
jgi:hypothetical protein